MHVYSWIEFSSVAAWPLGEISANALPVKLNLIDN